MLIVLYFLIAIVEIIGEYFKILPLVFIFKPLLMILLGYWFYGATNNTKNLVYRKRLLISIAFAFGGDTFLMFERFNENFFLLGLGSFLFGQIFYALAFIDSIKKSDRRHSQGSRLAFLFVFISYYVVFMQYLFPRLGEFLIPVLVYGVAICFMGITAAWRFQKVDQSSFYLVFFGAMLFVTSDSIIAINQFVFKGNLWNAQVFIMLTYVTAQYLLAKGSVQYLNTSE